MEEVTFDWDAGNVRHVGRHDINPQEAEQIILDPDAVMLEIQIAGDEDRIKAIGRTARGRILVVVFTFRGEAIRPITAYNATIRDQHLYLKGHHG